MSDRWKCPLCKEIFLKNAGIKIMEKRYRDGGLKLSNPLLCPECRQQMNVDDFLKGKYDLPKVPSPENLDKEFFDFFTMLTLNSTNTSMTSEEMTGYAINQASKIIYDKYGLGREDIMEIIDRVFDNNS